MGKYGSQKYKEVTLVITNGLQNIPDSVSLQVGDDLVIPYDESQIAKVTLPAGLFSPSGRGVSERTAREPDGSLVRSATAFYPGRGDIVLRTVDGVEKRVSCLIAARKD